MSKQMNKNSAKEQKWMNERILMRMSEITEEEI